MRQEGQEGQKKNKIVSNLLTPTQPYSLSLSICNAVLKQPKPKSATTAAVANLLSKAPADSVSLCDTIVLILSTF
eukprot:COSAG01_NODE_3280_length_6312_cov_45.174823_7_plen_75_part_00